MVISDVMLDQACYDSGVLMVRWEGTFVSKMTNDILGEAFQDTFFSLKVNLCAPLAGGSFEGLFVQGIFQNRSSRRAHSSPCFANNVSKLI